MDSELKYQIALTRIDGVGCSLAKNLVRFCGSASAVFSEKRAVLKSIPGIGSITAENIFRFRSFSDIEAEIIRHEKHGISSLFFMDDAYPQRLRHCDDGPVLLYYKGKADLNSRRMISVVGTRRSTIYGKQFTDDLLQALSIYGVTIVSGLASGTDTNAHRAALKNGLPTIGVLGHGFSTMFPRDNRPLAEEMTMQGGILTEYPFDMPGSKENFPKRNRIVAGISDALIVVESGIRGGSMITADLANQYNKDVYALPGKTSDYWSQGCNRLISNHQAAIIDNVPNLIRLLGFDLPSRKQQKSVQMELISELSPDEQQIYKVLDEGAVGIDELHYRSEMPISKLVMTLLDMEFRKLIQCLPGKMYALVNRS